MRWLSFFLLIILKIDTIFERMQMLEQSSFVNLHRRWFSVKTRKVLTSSLPITVASGIMCALAADIGLGLIELTTAMTRHTLTWLGGFAMVVPPAFCPPPTTCSVTPAQVFLNICKSNTAAFKIKLARTLVKGRAPRSQRANQKCNAASAVF